MFFLDFETCPYCAQEIAASDAKSIVLGVTAHEACYRKKQAALAEKYAEQDRKVAEKSVCRYCNTEVQPNQERIVVLGAESHRDCYVKHTYVEQKVCLPGVMRFLGLT